MKGYNPDKGNYDKGMLCNQQNKKSFVLRCNKF